MSENPVGRTAIRSGDPDLVIERTAVDVLRSIPTADGCFIALVEGDELVCEFGLGTFAESLGLRLRIDASLAGLSLQTGTPFRCDDAETNPLVDRATARRLNVASILSAPLKDGKRPFGALVATSSEIEAFVDPDLQTLVETAQSLMKRLTRRKPRGLGILSSRRR